MRRSLRVSFKAVHLLQILFTAGKKVRCVVAVPAAKDLETIKGLIDADVIKTLVDRSFPMEEASGAHRYVEQGERKGPVVIVMKREGGSDGK
jgi:NADPH:quinone reductase-like Zn-dependent oxidoreductase